MSEQDSRHDRGSPVVSSITERKEERTSAWWMRYLPTDTKSALTVLVVLTCLIIGTIVALQKGDLSMLLALLKSIFSMP